MNPYAQQAYQKTAVSAIYEKERLVVMVYEGLADFLRQAREAMGEGRKARKGEAISSVLALLTELDCALDREVGGELATNLADLYQWMMGRLTEANLRNDLQALGEVERVVAELKEGFEGAAKQLASQPAEPAAMARSVNPAALAGQPEVVASARRLSYAV